MKPWIRLESIYSDRRIQQAEVGAAETLKQHEKPQRVDHTLSLQVTVAHWCQDLHAGRTVGESYVHL